MIYGSTPPAVSGHWTLEVDNAPVADWDAMIDVLHTSKWPNAGAAGGSSYIYDATFWAELCAAVEHGGHAADAPWNKVVNGITNLYTWKAGFRACPRFSRWPRNK